MRIPYPERIPTGRVAAFAILLFFVQTIEHTPIYFSAGCTAIILISTIAFNIAGGLSSASGAFVFIYSMLVIIVGICYKALLGEAADSNLEDPHTTIAVYIGIMAGVLAAVIVSRQFSRKIAFFQTVLKDKDMYRSSVGCIVFAIGGPMLLSLLGNSGAALNSAFGQLNKLIPLAILIGVMYEIRRSGGTRSVNAPVLIASIYVFLDNGIIGFSKQGMITPIYCWLLPVASLRYRLSNLQVVSSILGVFIIFHYLVPYSQYGRRFVTDTTTYSQRFDVTIKLLSHPEDTRKKNTEVQEEVGVEHNYYTKPQGLWDRLQFVSVDDALINITDQGHVFGLSPLRISLLNTIPHFLYPNKAVVDFGNEYAHEIGGIPDDDHSTGVSFSVASDSYHQAKWIGVLVVVPLLLILQFTILDSLFGNLGTTPWGLLVVTLLSHVAPEGGVSGIIYMFTFGVEIFAFSAFFAAWVAPTLAVLVLGRDRRRGPQPTIPRPILVPRTPN